MPDHGEGDFTRISQGLQGARADVQPAAYGVVVEPFVDLGRVANELLDAVDKFGKSGAMSLPSLVIYKDDLHGVLIRMRLRNWIEASQCDCPRLLFLLEAKVGERTRCAAGRGRTEDKEGKDWKHMGLIVSNSLRPSDFLVHF